MGYMGDTIALYRPMGTLLRSAKSPSIIVKTFTLAPGAYDFYVGYIAHPNSFPDEYWANSSNKLSGTLIEFKDVVNASSFL